MRFISKFIFLLHCVIYTSILVVPDTGLTMDTSSEESLDSGKQKKTPNVAQKKKQAQQKKQEQKKKQAQKKLQQEREKPQPVENLKRRQEPTGDQVGPQPKKQKTTPELKRKSSQVNVLSSPAKSISGRETSTSVQKKAPKRRKTYQGYRLSEPITNIRVRPCITLGNSCTQQMAEFVKEADQFIVVFMYRFNAPNLIEALANKYIESQMTDKNFPVLVFLDHGESIGDNTYHSYVNHLINSVPTSLVKIGSDSKHFHHKVMIFKKKGQQAYVSIGSANATYDSDNSHSDDSLIIQSNRVAKILLAEFKEILRMEGVSVYHEHRIYEDDNKQKSNIDKLDDLINLLKGNETIDQGFGYKADIQSLAISTSYSGNKTEVGGTGQEKCLHIFKDILTNNQNKGIVLFENYLIFREDQGSQAQRKVYQQIWADLLNNVPKLIVLDDDSNNKYAIERFKASQKAAVTALLFSPYTKGKFHHKLILQYLKDQDHPIIYTGSLNLSHNAVTNESEIIIGISCPELEQDYLSSILWQSDLGNQIPVWQFILRNPQLFFYGQEPFNNKIALVGKKIRQRTQLNMKKYYDRFRAVIEKMSSLSEIIGNKLRKQMIQLIFPDQSSFQDNFDTFYKISSAKKLMMLEQGRKMIFYRTPKEDQSAFDTCYNDIILKKIEKIKTSHPQEQWKEILIPDWEEKDIQENLNKIKTWLDSLKAWIEDAEPKFKGKETSEAFKGLGMIYSFLRDAYEYPILFKDLKDLDDVLRDLK